MSHDPAAIRVNGLSKRYVVGRTGRTPLGQLRNRVAVRDTVQAVHDVSFEVARGERVGIIGPNGAGKSTLLRMVCGITEPDAGSVWLGGETVPIIGLQAGFKKELTGRQNIDIKARLYGMSQQAIERRRDEIAEFADIGRFIDEPMSTYSKGMQARLAFAVAFSMDPEILIVDETLSGGDDAFKRKTMQRLKEIKDAGTTILLVTHGPGMIRQLCDRVLLMDRGEKLLEGDPRTALDAYQRLTVADETGREQVRQELRAEAHGSYAAAPAATAGAGAVPDAAIRPEQAPTVTPRASTSNGARIDRVTLIDAVGESVDRLATHAVAGVRVAGVLNEPAADLRITVIVRDRSGLAVARLCAEQEGTHSVHGRRTLRAELGFENRLLPGWYFLDAIVSGRIGTQRIEMHTLHDAAGFLIEGDSAEGDADEVRIDLTRSAELTVTDV